MIRRIPASRRVRVLAAAVSLTTIFLIATGCSNEEVKLAEVPADATEKVKQGQVKPLTKAELLPPQRSQSQGKPY